MLRGEVDIGRAGVVGEGPLTGPLLEALEAAPFCAEASARSVVDDLEEAVHWQRRGSVGAAQAAEDEEQLGAIVQTLQCLSANVEEARTFLGKMGKTKEGAYDASVMASPRSSGYSAPEELRSYGQSRRAWCTHHACQ